jgi:ppGpp synthetase/RelA/SpoT-type nucleotidyltranferase
MAVAPAEIRAVALARYRGQQPTYREAGRAVSARIMAAARRTGIQCTASSREKSLASFSKKMIRKQYADPWAEITDKAGVRITAFYAADVDRLRDLVISLYPDPVEVKDFREQLGDNVLGYGGVHVTVSADATSRPASEPLICEVQLRTHAQGVWSEINHHLTYKPDADVPPTVRRDLYRLAALMEVFDAEVERVVKTMEAGPGYITSRLLRLAEEVYFDYASVDYDAALSRDVLQALQPTIPTDLDSYGPHLADWSESHRGKLEDRIGRYGEDPAVPLLSQPEIVILFERLDDNPDAVERHWAEALPPDLLTEVQTIWGVELAG